MTFFRASALMVSSVLVLSSAALADDSVAQSLYAEAQTAYEGREDLRNIEVALAKLDQALVQAESSDLKYDILILSSRALYFKGHKARGNAIKMQIHEEAMNKATAAKAIDDQYAEAYFQYAINLGRWAEAKGIAASLGRKDELIANAEAAIERITRDGNDGIEVDSYGPYRTLGRAYFKLPGFAGGSRERSLEYLSQAYEFGKENALNVVYYAETLASGNRSDKEAAKQILDELLANDAATYNPARGPETQEEFELARALRRDLGR